VTSQRNGGRPETVITIGVFDGVHLGHQALIGRVVERANLFGVESGCVTFEPHPQELLQPGSSVVRLSTLEDRIQMIKALGVGEVLLLQFTLSLAQMSPEGFIDLLVSHFRLRELWIGSDFALGRHRGGTPDRLAVIGRERGFEVHAFPRVEIDGAPVSSSRIRVLLAEGAVEEATGLLGRYHRLVGKVVSGDRRARVLGYPTANLEVADGLCLPRDGVYAVRCGGFDGRCYRGVCNVGMRPTFNGVRRQVEVHLIGFQGDLYGQRLAVDVLAHLRDEVRFASVEALVNQIGEDIKQAEKLHVPVADRGGLC